MTRKGRNAMAWDPNELARSVDDPMSVADELTWQYMQAEPRERDRLVKVIEKALTFRVNDHSEPEWLWDVYKPGGMALILADAVMRALHTSETDTTDLCDCRHHASSHCLLDEQFYNCNVAGCGCTWFTTDWKLDCPANRDLPHVVLPDGYYCVVCGDVIEDDAHTDTETGGDVHPECCPQCTGRQPT